MLYFTGVRRCMIYLHMHRESILRKLGTLFGKEDEWKKGSLRRRRKKIGRRRRRPSNLRLETFGLSKQIGEGKREKCMKKGVQKLGKRLSKTRFLGYKYW